MHGKGDQVRTVPSPPTPRARVSAWLDLRGRQPGPLWTGQRGALTISGIIQVVPAVGDNAKLPGLRPHRLRHTYATRLREAGAQVQALLGHAPSTPRLGISALAQPSKPPSSTASPTSTFPGSSTGS
ncbi:tyrosine-type recombinase/integrase [Nonomuraea jiangxiensis]|uniref:tyrosine-type recombinase/integrase n=1 Tax=Nonomuraea jiangxiensis TaxID=633440 RepID=UPI003CCC28CF